MTAGRANFTARGKAVDTHDAHLEEAGELQADTANLIEPDHLRLALERRQPAAISNPLAATVGVRANPQGPVPYVPHTTERAVQGLNLSRGWIVAKGPAHLHGYR